MSEPIYERALDPGQCSALDEVAHAVDAARTEVGNAFLRYQEIKANYEKVAAHLKNVEARARQAEREHQNVMSGIAQLLKLPEGRWVYDRARSTLVRKE